MNILAASLLRRSLFALFFAVGLLGGSLFISGCDTLISEANTDVPPNEILRVETEGNPRIAANGVDRIAILGYIPESAGLLDVTFSTTKGSFVRTAGPSITLSADSTYQDTSRYARAVLQSDTTAGTAWVTVTVSGTHRRFLDIVFDPVESRSTPIPSGNVGMPLWPTPSFSSPLHRCPGRSEAKTLGFIPQCNSATGFADMRLSDGPRICGRRALSGATRSLRRKEPVSNPT